MTWDVLREYELGHMNLSITVFLLSSLFALFV